MIDPVESDIGRTVKYIPTHAQGDPDHEDCEIGKITGFNERSVFVLYEGREHSQGTYKDDLLFIDVNG